MSRQVFFSFCYNDDVWRVSQIRNIGVIEGNPPCSDNEWEEVKRKGDDAIKKWIDDSMKNSVIVLIGENTAGRKWVEYEIKKAWTDGKGLFGIYIHNIKDSNCEKSKKGRNPFELIPLKDGRRLSDAVKVYDPNPNDAYNDIAAHIERWIEEAISRRK